MDLIRSTGHDIHCERDFALAARHGLRAARDGFRWHLIEQRPGVYDWSSILPMLRAARKEQVRVIWDLCHYGYPDWLDIWSDEFLQRFAAFCAEAVKLIRAESGQPPVICAVNEISFWAWLGGKEGKINPYAIDRPEDLKQQLVRAALIGIEAARNADPETTVISAEPMINIVPDSDEPGDLEAARNYHEAQFAALDMTLGVQTPELGGHEQAIDIIGVNFYPHNQWRLQGGPVPLGRHDYRPCSEMLGDMYARYGKPMFIAETGAEHSARPVWLHYVAQEVRTAVEAGVPIVGICLYPVTDYGGWDNDRACEVGLFCSPDEAGDRRVYRPLADELRRQQGLFGEQV